MSSVYDGTTVSSGTVLQIGAPATVSNVTVNGGIVAVSGGSTVSTTVNSGGYEYVSVGTNPYSGGAWVNGTTTNTTVNSGGFEVASRGGTASGAVVNSGGYLVVQSMGLATDATVSSGGIEIMSAGGTTVNTVVDGGTIIALPGSVLTGTTVLNGGQVLSTGVFVFNASLGLTSNGASLTSTVITGGAGTEEDVLASGTATSTTVANGYYVYVFGGGTTIDTQVNSWGNEVVYSGGTANGTTVQGDFAVQIVSSGGTAINTIVNAGGYELVSSGGTVISATMNSGGLMQNFGTVSNTTLNNSATILQYAGIAIGTTVNSGGYLELFSDTANGTTVNSGGTLYAASGSTAIGTTVNSGGMLYAASGSTAIGTTVAVGGKILLEAVSYGSGETATISSGVLQVSSGGTLVYSQQLAGIYTGDVFLVTSDTFTSNTSGTLLTLETAPLCFLRGTRIMTSTGEVPVEELAIGDLVVTRWQGIQSVKWIGRQSFAGRFIRNNRAKLPVHIHAGALGNRLPARDLFVSPGHSMLLNDTLVLASSLVNGVTITQDHVPEEVHYYHIEFETHDCVIAEGAWSESYIETNEHRAQFNNAAEFERLYPGYRAPEDLALCAPRPECGLPLEAVLSPVVARATTGLVPGALRGFIDTTTGSEKVEGWAQDQEYPELPVLLEVLLNGQALGTVLACDYRHDLDEAGLGQGRCSFSFVSPVKIPPEARHNIRVRRASDGAELHSLIGGSIDAQAKHPTELAQLCG